MKGGEKFQGFGPTHLPRKLFTLSFACHKFRLVPRRSLFIMGIPNSQASFMDICLFREKAVSEYIPSNQKYHPYNFMNVVSSLCFLPIHSFIHLSSI
jgi:hypothetical protein